VTVMSQIEIVTSADIP